MSGKSRLHIQNHIKNFSLAGDNTLHVIGVIQNPVRYQSRYRLFFDWLERMCATPNVKVHVVEAVYANRGPECNPDHSCLYPHLPGQVLQYEYMSVFTESEMWLKENLINLAVKNLLPSDWKYMAWVDCDVNFRNENWSQDALHALQHYEVIQPWVNALDLDFWGNVFQTFTSIGNLIGTGQPVVRNPKKEYPYKYGHTGYAWACTRYFYENIGKLLDIGILGAGDHHMAWGCLNRIAETVPGGINNGYLQMCLEWQRNAYRATNGLIGYCNGTIEHNFHGPKTRRQYWGRWDILKKNDYNPQTDITFDRQGIMELCGSNQNRIEHEIMLYNRSRNEDSLEQF